MTISKRNVKSDFNGEYGEYFMDDSTERQLRGPLLVLLLAISGLCILVGVLALSGSMSIAVGATVFFGFVTLLGVFYGVYRDFLEPVEQASHPAQVDTETAGVRPEEEYADLDITDEDVEAAQMTPKKLAKIIISSPNWHSAGNGGYSQWWRPRLKRLLDGRRITPFQFEIFLMGLTVTSIIVVFLAIFSMFSAFPLPEEVSLWYVDLAATIYPQNLSTEVNAAVFTVAMGITAIGMNYFSFKDWSTCPYCDTHFALQSLDRYYKPQHQREEKRREGDQVVRYRITHGVHIFKCEDCGRWTVPQGQWKEKVA